MKAVLDKLELAFAAFGGFIGWFLGGFDGFLYALVVFVVMDYFTGVLAAGVKKELSSEVQGDRQEGVHFRAGRHRQYRGHPGDP